MSRVSSSGQSSRGTAKPYPDEDAVTRQMLMDDDAGLFSKPLTQKELKALFARQKQAKAK